jgi:solute carrier family 25 carnitine/acylcarnitine transporter 20/29
METTKELADSKYFAFGALSGMTGVLISHPFDTIKTHIQNNKSINYNFKNLYRGITPPLCGVGLEKALVFGSYELANKYFNNVFISGLTAGLTASLIVTPYERLKILIQMNNSHKNISKNLSLPFLYKGLTTTFTREVPGFGIYFSVYNYGISKIYNNQAPTSIGSFLLGGLSGAVAWLFIYPQDMIKTRLQSALDNKKTAKEIIQEIYKSNNKNKLLQFYKGFHLALLRAIPLHAGTFCAMDYLKKNF